MPANIKPQRLTEGFAEGHRKAEIRTPPKLVAGWQRDW